jgi:excisionase family DNA binding protein
MAIERRWLTCKEAGEYLGLKPKTVDDLCLRGEIPSVKIGGSRRVDLKALEAGLERQLAEHEAKGRRR